MESPALARGLELWRLIERQGPMSLGELAAATQLPKSSLLRLLETLENHGLIVRELPAKLYSLAARLVPMDVPRDLEAIVPSVLNELSTQTRATAEWYVPTTQGLLLLRRSEPVENEVGVRAKTGFIRTLTGELESVCALANAWFRPAAAEYNGYHAYLKDGVRQTLSSSAARARIEAAHSNGWAVDTAFNENGVRRHACVVVRDGKALGVLSLAEVYKLPRRPSADDLLEKLLTHGAVLNHDALFAYGPRS